MGESFPGTIKAQDVCMVMQSLTFMPFSPLFEVLPTKKVTITRTNSKIKFWNEDIVSFALAPFPLFWQ